MELSNKQPSVSGANPTKAKAPFFAFGQGHASPVAFFQPKLTINHPNDPYEQEADAMAEKVMRMPDPAIQKKCADCQQEEEQQVQLKPNLLIQKQDETDPPVESPATPATDFQLPMPSLLQPSTHPDFLAMRQPFYQRNIFHLWDPGSALQVWNYNFDFFRGLGLAPDLAASASNFTAPFSIDSQLKAGNQTWWEITDRDMGTTTYNASLPILDFNADFSPTAPSWVKMLFGGGAPAVQRKCDACAEEEEKSVQLKASPGQAPASDGFENYVSGLNGTGEQLPAEVRSFYEPRFGYDFSNVKIHTDAAAAASAKSINALAYTTGTNIVFGDGKYDPGNDNGKRLLGHELTHVVQQSGGIQTKQIQRATVSVNDQVVSIDYGNIIHETNYFTGVQTAINTYTGAAPTPSMITALSALSASQQRWLLFALDVLTDNTTAVHAALNRADAVNRLIAFVPSATRQPLGGGISDIQLFAREVLIAAGWTDIALTAGLNTPGATDRAAIDLIVNPPTSGSGRLKVSMLNARLRKALRSFLKAIDPALITAVGRQSMPNIRAIGDLILQEARLFFSPFSDASSTSVFNVNPSWVASANISDTTVQVPNTADRIGYLRNRAQIVGWNSSSSVNIPDTNIFADVNFDGTRDADRKELMSIVKSIENDLGMRAIVDRLVQHTGFQTGSGSSTEIGINPEFNSSNTTECEARWRTIDTLCHEVLHAMVHPKFHAAAAGVSFNQVIREGFTEVLGNQLFNDHVVIKAAADPAFKASLEIGITSSPCPVPAAGTIGYGSAGTGAEAIRTRVLDNNFRAAYFLGRPDLAGL